MARVSADNSGQAYEPPQLPDYLRNVYELKTIVGVPSDDEVKGIHAVIRAANTVAQVPGMFDPELSMDLTQHLFNAQMARYQDKYPCIFVRTTVYTPPSLPAHVPVTLEPITGAPSNEEIQQVHAAARTYNQFSNIPAMFDPSVSMELSQHLFNIQLARYIQQAAQGLPVTESTPSYPKDEELTVLAGPAVITHEPVEHVKSTQQGGGDDKKKGGWWGEGKKDPQPVHATVGVVNNQSRPRPAATNDSDRLLEKLVETMEDVKQVLVGTQHSLARGARAVHEKSTYGLPGAYEMINDKGERPTTHGLPVIMRGSDYKWNLNGMTNERLAQYLQFYGVGSELIEDGDVLTIKEERRDDAVNVLWNYVK